MAPMQFHTYLKIQRQKKHLRQVELAQALHITRQAYSNYEQGRCLPTVHTLAELCILLETDFFSIFLADAQRRNYRPYK